MRTDAAAGRGVAHHQVVQARERQERKPAQQRIAGGLDQVHALHEQRPVARRERVEVGAAERAMRERPARSLAHDEARFDVVAPREREELAQRERPANAGNACRTSNGSLCQWRRRNAAAARPPNGTPWASECRGAAEAAIGRL